MTTYTIYKMTFEGSDQVYIGQTSQTLEQRRHEHYSCRNKSEYANNPLYKYIGSMQKKAHLYLDPIVVCYTKDDANRLEKAEIARHRQMTDVRVFNQTDGGPGITGYKYPEDKLYRFQGENNYSAKLTWSEVNEIRNFPKGTDRKVLSRLYNVSKATIQRIISGNGWKQP